MRVRHLGRAKRRSLAGLAICATLAMVMSGCSPSNYPAILATPTPRDDPPMTPDQVKQATDNLISDRNQLSAQVQAGQTDGSAAATTPASGTQPAGAPAKP
jgi:hypothetical protein